MIKYRCRNNFEPLTFRNALSKLRWKQQTTVSDSVINFNVNFKDILNKYAPVKRKRVKRDVQPIWFNNNIKAKIRERDREKKKGNHDSYKKLRNEIKNNVKES